MQLVSTVAGSSLAVLLREIGNAKIKLDLTSADTPQQLADLAVKTLDLQPVDAHLLALRTLLLFAFIHEQMPELEARGMFKGNDAAVAISPVVYAAVGQAPLQIGKKGFKYDSGDILAKAVALQDQLRK